MEQERIGRPDAGPADDPVAAAAGLARLQQALFGRRRLPPRLARYLLLQRLSAGGMGVVYRAYDPQLDRPVAIKLIEAIPGEPELTARYLAEAHALAALSHPNVVRIYDVGTYDGAEATADPEVAALLPTGGIFLVLELVEGRSLEAWVAEGDHGWSEIRDAYVQAGLGLVAAHAAGLVHHDFKPANAVRGEDGRVRVLDFGLAREVNDDAEPTSADDTGDEPLVRGTVTRAGPDTRATGTPLYMAPEQHEGGHTGPATDQFAFCVALYEALYGMLPFGGQTLADIAAHKHRGGVEPPAGHTVPGWLGRAVIRGLAPSPEARWPSMKALLHALERDRRRSRWGRRVVGLTVVGGLLAGAIVAAYRGPADVCDAPRTALNGVWDAPREARARAAFEAVPRSYATTTWRAVDRRLDRYHDAWIEQLDAVCSPSGPPAGEESLRPLARACLMQRRRELKSTVNALFEADEGLVDHATALLETLEPPSRCGDPAHLRMAAALPEDPARREAVERAYERLTQAQTLRIAGRKDDAVAVAREVAVEAESLGYPPLRADALRHVAMARTVAGDERGGLEALRGSIAAAIATNNHESAAWAWIDLVFDEVNLGAGYLAAQELVPVAERAVARMHDRPMMASWLNTVGAVHLNGGDPERGLAVLREAEALIDADFGPGRTLRVHENLALAHGMLDQWDVAHTRMEGLLDQIMEHYGPGHPDEALARLNVAAIEFERDHYPEAIEQCRASIGILRAVYGDHPRIASAMSTMAEAHYQQGQLEQAHAVAEAALTEADRVEGSADSARDGALHLLADLEERAGRLELAHRYRTRSVEIEERTSGLDHPKTWLVRIDLAELDALRGRPSEARATLQAAVAWLNADSRARPRTRCWIQGQIGATHGALDELDAALEWYERALSCAQAHDLSLQDQAIHAMALARALVTRDRPRAVALVRRHQANMPLADRETVETWLREHDSP